MVSITCEKCYYQGQGEPDELEYYGAKEYDLFGFRGVNLCRCCRRNFELLATTVALKCELKALVKMDFNLNKIADADTLWVDFAGRVLDHIEDWLDGT